MYWGRQYVVPSTDSSFVRRPDSVDVELVGFRYIGGHLGENHAFAAAGRPRARLISLLQDGAIQTWALISNTRWFGEREMTYLNLTTRVWPIPMARPEANLKYSRVSVPDRGPTVPYALTALPVRVYGTGTYVRL